MKVRASIKKRTPDSRSLDVKAVCMLLVKRILSINNVKDNLLFLEEK